MRTGIVDQYVVWRNDNVVHVDFGHEPDPPTPTFPGAGSSRSCETVLSDWSDRIVGAKQCSHRSLRVHYALLAWPYGKEARKSA
jgi:hypothetical protein